MHGFLGWVALDGTLIKHIQLANGNVAATADSPPTFKVYGPAGQIGTDGTCSSVVDSQTGWHRITIAATALTGFARGCYSVRVTYEVSAAAKVQDYTFMVD